MEQKNFSPQYPIPLVQQAAEFLTNAIIEGQLKHGQPLVENELQKKFNISRAPIREAFRVLEKNGLVVIIPRKGTFVREITRKDIQDLFPVRACLEGMAARMAVSHLKPQDIKKMKLALSGMIEAAKVKDFKTYFKYHLESHEIFINASKNEVLIKILENLRRQAIWFRFTYLWHEEKYDRAISNHKKILELFIEKDADAVGKLVEQHILIALDVFNKYLTEQAGKE